MDATAPAFLLIAAYGLTGAAAGFSAGLLGIGGGLIIVPVLAQLFASDTALAGAAMPLALGTSLATIIVTAIASARAHHHKGAVIWPLVAALSPGILLGAWLGGQLASSADQQLLKILFAIFELLIAGQMLKKAITPKPAKHAPQAENDTPASACLTPMTALAGGGVIGGVSAILGIGGGTLSVPFLHWRGVPIKNAIATSAACGAPIALAGALAYAWGGWQAGFTAPGHATLGYIELTAFVLISLTSMAFAPLGANLAHRLPDRALKSTFALLLLLLGVSMLLKVGG